MMKMSSLIHDKMRQALFAWLLSILFLSLLTTSPALAQEVKKGSANTWFAILTRFQLNDKWSVSNELHERTGAFMHTQGQFLFRPSIDFHLNQQVELTVGSTFVHVSPYAPYSLPIARNENNLWEQIILKNTIGKVRFLHRFRQEHRWINHIENTNGEPKIEGNDFANRFRYRLILNVDLFKFKKNQQALFLSAWDEIWIAQSKNLAPADFNRNWFYLGLGYAINQNTNIQAGFLQQYDKVAANANISTAVLQLTFVKNFQLHH
jgi:hypothetical protein